jgi:hypothetical protein
MKRPNHTAGIALTAAAALGGGLLIAAPAADAATIHPNTSIEERTCSGNNYGSVSYNDGSGEQADSFGPAEDIYFPAGASALSLKITKWGGSSVC